MESVGMAPTPEQLQRVKTMQATAQNTPTKKKKGKESKTVVEVNDFPLLRVEVQQILYGLHWQYQKKILDILKIVTEPSKWDTVRTIAMDSMTEQIETTRTLVGRRISDYLARENKEI